MSKTKLENGENAKTACLQNSKSDGNLDASSKMTGVSSVNFILMLLTMSGITSLENNFNICCDKGERWAKEQITGCDNFPVPVADIPMEFQVAKHLLDLLLPGYIRVIHGHGLIARGVGVIMHGGVPMYDKS